MPEISVIVPIYNTKAFLEDCLKSISNQSFRDFEAILVDDGSTDGSFDLAQKIIESDSRFKIIHQENQGLSAARNTGLGLVSAPWVTFIDSDDVWHHDFLATIYGSAKKYNADICCSGKKSFQNYPRISNEKPLIKNAQVLTPTEALTSAFYQKDKPDYSAWNKIFKTELWLEKSFPKGIFFEDFATIPSIFQKAQKIVFVDAPLYLYRKRNTSILATGYTLKKTELLDIAEANYNHYKNDLSLKSAAESMLISASFSIIMRAPNTEEFAHVHNRAWNWILQFRKNAIFNKQTRFRNKMAAIFSYLGKELFQKIFTKVQK